MWPKVVVIKTNCGTLQFDRFEDGSLNIYGHNDHGVVTIDRAVSGREAEPLERLFKEVAPRSMQALELRLAALLGDEP